MVSQPRAPPDILLTIIDHLGYQTQICDYDSVSWNALKACHSVSSSFRKQTLKYLFHRLIFPAEGQLELGPKQLLAAVENGDDEEYQRLAPYMKEFRFVLNIDYYSELDRYFARLPDIFERLSTAPFAIQNIHIEFPANVDIGWPAPGGEAFEKAFIKLSSSPSCRSFTLLDVYGFPARLLQAGDRGIKHLKLFHSVIEEETGGNVVPRFRPTNIDTDSTSSIFSIFYPASTGTSTSIRLPSFESLQHLTINSIRENQGTTFEHTQKMVTSAGRSLQTLSMHFESKAFKVLSPLDLSSSDSLKSIHLSMTVNRMYNYGYGGTQVALGDPLLDISSPAKGLENITVKAQLVIVAKTFDKVSQEHLKRLSDVLTIDRYPKLNALCFDFNINRIPEGEADIIFQDLKPSLAEQVRDVFPELQAQDVKITTLLSMDPPQVVGVPF